jgi:hypothetical protein
MKVVAEIQIPGGKYQLLSPSLITYEFPPLSAKIFNCGKESKKARSLANNLSRPFFPKVSFSF